MILILFDNRGNPIPLLDNNSGVINIPSSSVGLVNVHQLFIMEKMMYSGNQLRLSGIETDNKLVMEVSGEGFYMTTVEEIDGIPTSVKNTNIVIPSNSLSPITYDSNGYRTSGDVHNSPIQIHLTANSNIGGEKFGSFKVSLIDGSNSTINEWNFQVYTELIEEDVRFSDILANMGEYLTHQHELIFKDSDINEDLPDLNLLNKKRKEFLTEIRTISPLSSTIRGIESVIDLFDYRNILFVKEYWYDESTNKVSIVPINEVEHSKNLEKLNKFGFFYHINEPTDELDENGLPVLKDNFIFTNDEIVIKLSALKEYFISKDIGGVSDIVDIVGEIYNFNALNIRQWRGINESISYIHTPDGGFEITSLLHYIEPIRKPYNNTEDQYSTLFDLKDKSLFELKDHQISFFDGYLDTHPNMYDDRYREIGCIIDLRNTTFSDTWMDIESDWDVDPDVFTSWKNVGSTGFYKTIWTVTKSDTTDGRHFEKSISGDCSDMAEVSIKVPYNGFYDIKVENIGYNNVISTAIIKKAVEVKLKDPNFLFCYKITNEAIQNWGGSTTTWEEANQEWNATKFDNTKFKIDNNEFLINKFRTTKVNLSENKFVNQKWRDADLPWEDLQFISFLDTEYVTHRHPKLHITSFSAGGILVIDDHYMQIPDDFSYENYGGLCEFLRTGFNEEFDFIPRKLSHINYIEVQRVWYGEKKTYNISCTSNITLESLGGVLDVPNQIILDTIHDNNLIGVTTHHKTYYQDDPFTSDNTRADENKLDVPTGVPFFMSVDNSEIGGKNKIHWEILNNDGKKEDEYDGEMFGFLPTKTGYYDILVTITDNNGNIYNLIKENIVKVMPNEDFELIEDNN
jgi:hypothetical protein